MASNSSLSRFIVRRNSDGFYYNPRLRYRVPERGWTPDIKKAKLYSNVGHPRLAIQPNNNEVPYPSWYGSNGPGDYPERRKAYAKAKREWFDKHYRIVRLEFTC